MKYIKLFRFEIYIGNHTQTPNILTISQKA